MASVEAAALIAGLSALALLALGQTAGLSTSAPDAVQPARAAAAAPFRQPVVSTGVVEIVRELPAEGNSAARQFELTIRMRDGTLRVSHETGGARWRPGDRVRLLGAPANR